MQIVNYNTTDIEFRHALVYFHNVNFVQDSQFKGIENTKIHLLYKGILSELKVWFFFQSERLHLYRKHIETLVQVNYLTGILKIKWFSLCTQVSSTYNTDCHDITETFFTVAFNTITLKITYIRNAKPQKINSLFLKRSLA